MYKRWLQRVAAVLLACSMLLVIGCGGHKKDTSDLSGPDGSEPISSDTGDNSDPSADPSGDSSGDTSGNTSGNTSKTPSGNHSSNSSGNHSGGNSGNNSGSSYDPSTIDYTKGSKPAKRATGINGFVRRQAQWLVDENGDEWFIKGGGIDGGSLGGAGGWNPANPDRNFCNESIYREHAKLGCNTIRFTFNEALFFQGKSNKFNDNGFKWIQENVDWAKKYNIRLILNMHVVPGATQGGSNEPNVFQDKNKSRWIVVWREIARRFANEPVILGYSFWNEQCAPTLGSWEESLAQYGKVYQECIDAVRQVDKKHLIICEQMNGRMDSNGGYGSMKFPAFPTLKEKNLMYEYHNYGPGEFTFQGDTQPYGLVWNSGAIASIGLYVSDTVEAGNTVSAGAVNGRSVEIDSGLLQVTDGNAVAAAMRLQFSGNLPGTAALCISAVRAEEYDASGNKTGTVYERRLSTESSAKHYQMSNAKVRLFESGTDGGAISFSNLTAGSGWVYTTNGEYWRVRSGYRYKIVVTLRGRSIPDGVTMRLGMVLHRSSLGKTLTMNKECLQAEIQPYVDYRNSNRVPVFCGEWGAYYKAYDKGLNSEQWAQDQLNVFKENQMYFTVHSPFAMYSKEIQPYSYAHNPEIKAGNYTVLENAFKRLLPSI